MNLEDYQLRQLPAWIESGSLGDLRRACDLADRIVDAVVTAKDEENLPKGFEAFRARNDYHEVEDASAGTVNFNPLAGGDLGAPPADNTSLGRFNAPKRPVLYLSTTKEVALAEARATLGQPCTIATFETDKPIRLARLLRHGEYPLSALLPTERSLDDLQKWLLADAADFVSRRPSDRDRETHYRACNLIGSAFKERGFDGVAYRTAFWSKSWRSENREAKVDAVLAANIVLFSPEAARPISAALYEIDWKRPEATYVYGGTWRE